MLSDSLELLRQFEAAISSRNKRATYVAAAKLVHSSNRGKPVDINKVRSVSHHYAAELFGWDMRDA